MSELHNDETDSLVATEIDMRAADWLQRRQFWNWSEEDQTTLDTWLAQSPAHEVAYWRLEAAWNETHRLAALHRPEREAAPRVRSRQRIVSVGAVVVAVIIMAGIGTRSYLTRPQVQNYTTALGERRTIALNEGSRIELNTNSVLRVLADADGRKVWLDKGEAYFEIAHDTRRSFVVIAGDKRITDLGTKFLVRRDTDHLSVALMEGRAKLDVLDDATKTLILRPGDVVNAKAHGLALARKSEGELKDELGWRHGVLIFKGTTLGEAVDEFNRYNNSKILVADAATARISIGGTFQSNNVTIFADAVHDLLGLHVENRGGVIVISR
ncbi:MAG TPA: FecR domain-containing protein [Rhizomicrobium sp.]|jgi:transmembrane sensor|nr:FecR domain-containing protein [Rhizomicrobium sp.]